MSSSWLAPIMIHLLTTARPKTPTVVSEDYKTEAAVTTLQRLLRGRAVQDYMFDGIQRKQDLIRELKLSDIVQGIEGDQKLNFCISFSASR